MKRLPSKTTLLLIFFLLVQIPLLLQPIGGGHKWRQAATASVARNLALESFNPFYPRVDVRKNFSGITGMEFPIYQSFVGVLYLFTSTSSDWQGHLISLIMAFGCISYIILFAKKLLNLNAKWIVCSIFCIQEFFLLSSRIMSETTALFFVLLGTWHFISYYELRKFRDLFLACIGLALGLLSRPYVAAWGLIIFMYFLLSISKRDFRSSIFLFCLGFIIITPFSFWYFIWSPYISETYYLEDYFFSGILNQNNFNQIFFELTSLFTWSKLINTILYDYLNWILTPFFILGIVKSFKYFKNNLEIKSILVWIPSLTVLVVLMTSGNHFSPHSYYFIGIIPALSIFVAQGLSEFETKYPKLGSKMIFFLPTITVMLLWYIYPAYLKDIKPFEKVIPLVKQKVLKNDLVVSEDLGPTSFSLHPIRRRGWVVPKEKINNINFVTQTKSLGAKWILPIVNEEYHLYEIETWESKLSEK